MAKTPSQELFDLARGAVAMGASTARKVAKDVREALKIDLGTVMFNAYRSHLDQGWPETRAKELTLQLAQQQLELKIAEAKRETLNG